MRIDSAACKMYAGYVLLEQIARQSSSFSWWLLQGFIVKKKIKKVYKQRFITHKCGPLTSPRRLRRASKSGDCQIPNDKI